MRHILEGRSLQRVVMQLAPFALAFSVYLAVFLVMRPDTAGDEPHYLLVAQSIAFDGDVDLANDYESRERTLRVVNAFPLDSFFQAAEYKDSGELRPVHAVGLSALLAPAVALGGLTGARLAIVLIAALLADQLYRLLRDLRLRRRYRNLAWVAAVMCLPILAFSSQIYPELPGALLVVVALRIMVAGAASPAALALGSTAAGALVWLHSRYLTLSLGILLGLALAACSDRQSRADNSTKGGLRDRLRQQVAALAGCAVTFVKRWRTVALPLVLPFAVSLGALAVAFERWYGSPSLQAPYSAYGNLSIGSGGWNFWYEFALRDLLHPTAGWIPFAPVHWVGLAALGCLVVRFGLPAAACVAMAAGYALLVASVGASVGWGFPARYLIIVIPLIAVPIAVVIQYVRAALVIFVPLLAASLVFAVAAVDDYQRLFAIGEQPRVFGVRSIAPAFPITQNYRFPTSFVLAPGQFRPPTGRVRENGNIVAIEGRDPAGFLLWGPYSSLRKGTYRATFPLAASGVGPDQPVATIEAVGSPPEENFARRVVTAGQLDPERNVTLEFATPGGYLAQTRVFYHGLGTLTAGSVRVEPEHVGARTRVPDWLLACMWVGGTVLAGWLFVRSMRLTRRHEHA